MLVTVAAIAGTPAASLAAIKSKESGVRLTSKTITVSRATVRKNLVGISADGIFKFKHANGALARLKAGKVMLLQGSDALIITRIAHSHGKLLVHTKPAALTDVISKGQISFSGAPNFHHAVLSKIVEPPAPKPRLTSPRRAIRMSAARQVRPGPRLPRPRHSRRRAPHRRSATR